MVIYSKEQVVIIKTILLSLIFIGCVANNTANPALQRNEAESTLVIGSRIGPGIFFPAYLTSTFDKAVTDLVFESLYKFNSITNSYDAVLAQALPQISEDGTSYLITLQPNITFSDGSRLTTRDVAFSHTLLADSSYTGFNRFFSEGLVGYDDYRSGYSNSFAGLNIIDDYNIEFIFTTSRLRNMAMLELPIVSAGYYHYPRGEQTILQSLFSSPLGSGRYILANYERGAAISLHKNINYWKNNEVIPNIKIVAVTASTELNLLLNGTIDMLVGVNLPAKVEQALNAPFINYSSYPRAGYNFLQFNLNDPQLQDVKVRQALNYGFNRALYQAIYLGDLAVDVPSPIDPNWLNLATNELNISNYAYNPILAAALLDEVGFTLSGDGFRYKDGQRLTVNWLAVKESIVTDIAVPIISENFRALGIDLNISFTDTHSLLAAVNGGQGGFTMASLSLFEEALPYNIVERWRSGSRQNTAGLNDAENDNLLQLFNNVQNIDELNNYFTLWLNRFNYLAPAIMLHSSLYFDLYNERINGVATTSHFTFRDNIPYLTIKEVTE